ncbi:MAG: DUF1684 domain-containing protein [Thermoflexales bacterium]|nr:DUF1684 domain-containing protein [Thermoflexales bacterium]
MVNGLESGCSMISLWACPILPQENRLTVRIEAGEN